MEKKTRMKIFKIAALGAGCVVGMVIAAIAAPSAPVAGAPPSATQIAVYDQPNFKGNALVFERSVPSLAKLNFNDRVASLKISGTRDWVLCEHRNFMGRCVRVRAKANDLKLLQIAGRVSSLYPVPAAPPAAQKHAR